MLGFTETITVCTPLYNTVTGKTDYHFCTIAGVSWHSKIKATITNNGGMVPSNLYRVRIPISASSDKAYVVPEDFINPETQYTITMESRIIKGEGIDLPVSPKEREDYLSGLDSTFTVKAIHDNRSFGLKHLYLEGV